MPWLNSSYARTLGSRKYCATYLAALATLLAKTIDQVVTWPQKNVQSYSWVSDKCGDGVAANEIENIQRSALLDVIQAPEWNPDGGA